MIPRLKEMKILHHSYCCATKLFGILFKSDNGNVRRRLPTKHFSCEILSFCIPDFSLKNDWKSKVKKSRLD